MLSAVRMIPEPPWAGRMAGAISGSAWDQGLPLAPSPTELFHNSQLEPLTKPWWQYWEFRPSVLLILLLMGLLYFRGWRRLSVVGNGRLVGPWHLLSYFLGIALLLVALLSGIDLYGERLFLMHMIQHELLMMIIPPLLLLARPMPVLMWGLPAAPRAQLARLMQRRSLFRTLLVQITRPDVCFAIFVMSLWLWHVPKAYDTAILNPFVHDLEHISFFGSAMIFWWHVIAAAPRIHKEAFAFRIVLILLAFVQNEALAVLIAFADEPLYQVYALGNGAWGLNPMQDQMWGAAIMWIPGGMMYGLAAIFLIARAANSMDAEGRRRQKIAQASSASADILQSASRT